MKQYIIIIIASMLILSSCISEKRVVRKYYTLEIPEEVNITKYDIAASVPGKCEIEQVSVNSVYAKNQIVNRNDSHEITYYMYHQWAVRPDEAIRELLYTYLDNKNLFGRIATRFSMSVPEYRMETSISRLEIIEGKKFFSAHIKLKLELVLNKNDSILISHHADRTEPLKRKDLNLFAGELSNILYEELEMFAGKVKELNGGF